jgi:hypothetical protein
MARASIFTEKELPQTYQPLLLCQFELSNGLFLRVSTHPLSSRYWGTPTAGSYEYGGYEWTPRVVNQNIGATQAMSDLGVDIPPQVSVVMADGDKTIYQTYEQQYGFKGAILTLYATMWDAGNSLTGSFSTDNPAPIKFIGTCSAAQQIDENTIVVTATSLLNMTQQQMPPIRIQPLCPWNFPPDAASRADALANNDSPFYQCGYSPDQPGGVGNFSSGTACFTTCDLSRAACIQNLGNAAVTNPIYQDTTGRHTARFGGFDYMPIQNVGMQRSYVTGQWELIINATNEARYGDYVPMCYGTTWVEPEIMGVYGDGNYTSFEVMLCFGVVDSITQVILNGDVISQLAADYADRPQNVIQSANITNDSQDNFWYTVNTGQRSGSPNAAPGWALQGDPYGSIAAIGLSILTQLASASTLPQCQVLLTAGQLRVYTDPSTYTFQATSNPAWILLDLLIQATWRYDNIDIQSFIDAAAVCDVQINFNSLNGDYQNYYNEVGEPEYLRYSIGFTIKQRTSIGELIRGVRNSMRAMLFFDFTSGLLKVMCRQTIADQQPSPITGSNYNEPVPSVTAGGDIQTGYVSYLFDENSIRKTDDNKTTLRVYQKGYQETPNKVTNYFFDRENQYNQDISTIIDVEDVNRIQAEVTGNFNLVGPQTYDHINRVTDTWFSENYRGNSRLDYEGSAIGDTGGTIMVEFETSVKAIHLEVGQIVLFYDAQTGIGGDLGGTPGQSFRVVKIQPSTNFETAKLTLQWHNDNWYQDTYGQGAHQPIYKNTLSAPNRPPYPWRAGVVGGDTTDIYFDSSDTTFGLALTYPGFGVPGCTYPCTLEINGLLPPNSFISTPRQPKLAVLGAAGTGGGYPPSSSIVCAVASSLVTAAVWPGFNPYELSAMSNVAAAYLPPGYNEPKFAVQAWPDDPVTYNVFAGLTADTMTFQYQGTGTPAGLDLTNQFVVAGAGPPDVAYSCLRFRLRPVYQSGLCTFDCTSASFSSGTTSLQIATNGNPLIVNQLAGREVSFLGAEPAFTYTESWPENDIVFLGIANFKILANSADALYVEDPNQQLMDIANLGGFLGGLPQLAPCIVTVRLLPTFGSDSIGNYFYDAMMINSGSFPMNQGSLEAIGVVTDATNASPIVITYDASIGLGGVLVVIQGVEGNTAANGAFYATGLGDTATLSTLGGGSTTGNGAFTGNGVLFYLNSVAQGPVSFGGSSISAFAFIFAGTGRNTFAAIQEVDITFSPPRYRIVGNWPVTPDSTSRIIIVGSYIYDEVTQPLNISIFGTFGRFYVDASKFPKNQPILVQVAKQSPDGVTLSSSVHDEYRETMIFNRFIFDGDITITIQGTLAIGSNQGQPAMVSVTEIPIVIVVQLGTVADAAVTVNVNSGGALIATIVVPAGSKVAEGNVYSQGYTPGLTFAEISLMPRYARLLAGLPITIDITSVGVTAIGADLTVTIHYIDQINPAGTIY